MALEYGEPSVVILPGVHHIFVPTPVMFAPVPGFEGPFVSANAAGVMKPKTMAKMRVTEVTFLNLSKSGVFIENKGNNKKYVTHHFYIFSNITMSTLLTIDYI